MYAPESTVFTALPLFWVNCPPSMHFSKKKRFILSVDLYLLGVVSLVLVDYLGSKIFISIFYVYKIVKQFL